MKALIIASLIFFSLRAISSEVGEERGSECKQTVQTNKREAKAVPTVVATDSKKEAKSISK
jgi:hypothetical protein